MKFHQIESLIISIFIDFGSLIELKLEFYPSYRFEIENTLTTIDLFLKLKEKFKDIEIISKILKNVLQENMHTDKLKL